MRGARCSPQQKRLFLPFATLINLMFETMITRQNEFSPNKHLQNKRFQTAFKILNDRMDALSGHPHSAPPYASYQRNTPASVEKGSLRELHCPPLRTANQQDAGPCCQQHAPRPDIQLQATRRNAVPVFARGSDLDLLSDVHLRVGVLEGVFVKSREHLFSLPVSQFVFPVLKSRSSFPGFSVCQEKLENCEQCENWENRPDQMFPVFQVFSPVFRVHFPSCEIPSQFPRKKWDTVKRKHFLEVKSA